MYPQSQPPALHFSRGPKIPTSKYPFKSKCGSSAARFDFILTRIWFCFAQNQTGPHMLISQVCEAHLSRNPTRSGSGKPDEHQYNFDCCRSLHRPLPRLGPPCGNNHLGLLLYACVKLYLCPVFQGRAGRLIFFIQLTIDGNGQKYGDRFCTDLFVAGALATI